MNPGDELRFAELYDAHYPKVLAYLISRAGRQLAEEAASETFVVAWRRFGDLPHDPLPWLLGVARNVLRDSHRASVRYEAAVEQFQHWAETTTGDVADGVVDRSEVLRAVAELADQDRELLILTAWHAMSARDAAQVLGCSRATFFVRLHRARRRLAAKLLGASTHTSVVASERTPK
ncbi:sigma-70 family RNA polymerase sigma factor [Kribbella sandramycini]|nr:sigma-70 family RNA polymerase sigma factor [Kribbella sandramycini]